MSDIEKMDLAAEGQREEQAKKIVDFFSKLNESDLQRADWPELTEDLVALYQAVDKKIDDLYLVHDRLHDALYEHLEEGEEKKVGPYTVRAEGGVIDIIYKL